MKGVALAAMAILVLGAGRLPAQGGSIQEQAYQSKRQELLKELNETQQQLSDLRSQRVQLQARIENVIANMMQQRAQELLMSHEQNALQQLDAILTSSQDNLLDQRDRFLAIGDAVKQRAGAVMVVLLRADSSQAETIQNLTLSIDSAGVATRNYSTTANGALQMGAVDELYRSNVLPTSHTLTVSMTVNGQPLTQTFTVNAAGQASTYVQFAVRNGQIVPTTWTARGTTPF